MGICFAAHEEKEGDDGNLLRGARDAAHQRICFWEFAFEKGFAAIKDKGVKGGGCVFNFLSKKNKKCRVKFQRLN